MKRFLILLAITFFLWPIQPAYAQGPIPGYNREMNEWYDICDDDTLDPDTSGFQPDEDLELYPAPQNPSNGAFFQIEDLNNSVDNPFYLLFYYFDVAPIPSPLSQEELVDDYITRNGEQCYWTAYVALDALPGQQLAKTPIEDFAQDVEFADVTFMFYYDDLELIGVFQYRPYKIVALWDDGLATEVTGSIDTTLEDYQMVIPSLDDPAYHAVAGYISQTISPRQGHYINSVWIEFEYPNLIDWGEWAGVIPSPTLLIDKILIRGFYRTTPLPTATPTRTPAPRTPTATATARPPLWATPTATILPTITPLATKQFPSRYSYPPTSIPVVRLSAWPAVPTMAPIPTPSTPLALALLPTPNFPDVSYVPVGPSTPTPTALSLTTNIISLTTWLSDTASITNTDSFTLASAPSWYAPTLPDEIANVGWTFEQMGGGIDTGQRYNIASWAGLAGYIAALPIQLTKSVMELFRFMGPFGYFVAWLLILLPAVLIFKWIEFIKNLIIKLFNFVLDLIRFVLELIKLIPFV